MNMIDWDSCVLWLDSKYFSESYWWDRSRYRNNGVVYGAEFKNESFYFDGSNDYVDCGDNDSLNIGDELSIECLFIPYGDGYIIAKRNWNNWDDAYALAYEEAYRRLIFLGNGASAARSNSNILPFNEKAHIVVTAKNSGSVKFYKNGKLINSEACPTFSGDGERCFVGARPNTDGTAASRIGAYIFFIRVYSKILSEEKIKILANNAGF